MKSLLVMFFALFSLTALAKADYECNGYEAQFIGQVRELKVHSNHFTFKVTPTRYYKASVLCPLEQSEFIQAEVSMQGTPAIKNGDEISGVMVYDLMTDMYFID